MFLQTLAGAKTLMGAAAWATCTLLGSQKDNRFPLTVTVHTGEQVVLSVVRLTLVFEESPSFQQRCTGFLPLVSCSMTAPT